MAVIDCSGASGIQFLGPGDSLPVGCTGLFYVSGYDASGTPIYAEVSAPTGVYHTQAGVYFGIPDATTGQNQLVNGFTQGVNDSTFTQGLVGGWLSNIIEVDGFNLQAEIQTALSDGVLTDSELLLLQYNMDQYTLEVSASTNILSSMKQAMQAVVNNLR